MYQFILEPYIGSGSRYICPQCGYRGAFVRYVDQQTGEHLAEHVGRCNRQDQCGYHYRPSNLFTDNPSLQRSLLQVEHSPPPLQPTKGKPPSFIPEHYFQQSLKTNCNNGFINFLQSAFPEEIVNKTVNTYQIGSSKHWPGATVFWQIDVNDKIRTGKIMLYNEVTGRRIKRPYNHITWVHSVLKTPAYNLNQCLFGEYLLRLDPFKTIGLVESEKAAVIASIYFPQLIWLATGGINNLNIVKCKALQGRTVLLYPDLNAYQTWKQKAREISAIAQVKVSDLLERNATDQERRDGLDLVDYLLRFPYNAVEVA